MSGRLYAILGGAAIAGGIAWFALRKGETTDAPPPPPPVAKAPTPEPPPPPPPKPVVAAPERPTLPTDDRPRPALPTNEVPTPPQLYAHERRDPTWGPETEKAIERKLAKLDGATLENTECHETECELTLGGDERGMQKAIAAMESKKGLADMAESLMLTAPSKRADGSLQLRAYAKFSR